MDSANLVQSISSELLGNNAIWLFFILTALFAGAGSYFGKYLGMKAANLATKEDFQSLQTQLSANTRLVETVKTEIARTDWVSREWDTLRIRKIEELVTWLHASEEYLTELRVVSIAGEFHKEQDPFGRGIIITELYLPELNEIVRKYNILCRKITIALSDNCVKGLQHPHLTKEQLWDHFFSGNGYPEWIATTHEVSQAAGQMLRKIVSAYDLTSHS